MKEKKYFLKRIFYAIVNKKEHVLVYEIDKNYIDLEELISKGKSTIQYKKEDIVLENSFYKACKDMDILLLKRELNNPLSFLEIKDFIKIYMVKDSLSEEKKREINDVIKVSLQCLLKEYQLKERCRSYTRFSKVLEGLLKRSMYLNYNQKKPILLTLPNHQCKEGSTELRKAFEETKEMSLFMMLPNDYSLLITPTMVTGGKTQNSRLIYQVK